MTPSNNALREVLMRDLQRIFLIAFVASVSAALGAVTGISLFPPEADADLASCYSRCMEIRDASPDPIAGWQVLSTAPCTCGVQLEAGL